MIDSVEKGFADASGIECFSQQHKITNKDIYIFERFSYSWERQVAGTGGLDCHTGRRWYFHSHLVKAVVRGLVLWAAEPLVGEVGNCFRGCVECGGAVIPTHGKHKG